MFESSTFKNQPAHRYGLKSSRGQIKMSWIRHGQIWHLVQPYYIQTFYTLQSPGSKYKQTKNI